MAFRNPFTGQFVSKRTWLENVIVEFDTDMKTAFRAQRYDEAKALSKDKAVYVAMLKELVA